MSLPLFKVGFNPLSLATSGIFLFLYEFLERSKSFDFEAFCTCNLLQSLATFCKGNKEKEFIKLSKIKNQQVKSLAHLLIKFASSNSLQVTSAALYFSAVVGFCSGKVGVITEEPFIGATWSQLKPLISLFCLQ